MFSKRKAWLLSHQSTIDFVYVATVFLATIYAVIWSINWILVAFLKFTYLDLVLLAWVVWSLGNVVSMYVYERIAIRASVNDVDIHFGADDNEEDEHERRFL